MIIFKPQKVICHHSLTKDSGSVSWGAIRLYHTQTLKRPYKDIGYHVGVELVKSGGELYYEALMGRMWTETGAHVRGHNLDSLGICFIGDYDKEVPKPQLVMAGAKVIALWLDLFQLSINDIYSHHNFAPHKSCPGKLFNMELLRDCVRRCYE